MKDTCKQATFRTRYQESKRSVEDPLTAGDQEERELEFFQHVYKRPVEYLAESWTRTEGTVRATES